MTIEVSYWHQAFLELIYVSPFIFTIYYLVGKILLL